MSSLICCNQKINDTELWILQDFNGFTKRKLLIGVCPKCKEKVVQRFETRISDNKVFTSALKGIEAVKTLYREGKRKLAAVPDIKMSGLYGWIYGCNVEIKNKNGKITQIRQYSSDFSNNKTLVKRIFVD